jgi:flagellar hook-associated protein 3 FlgL
MSFRVTERSIATNTMSGLQSNLSKLSDLQEQLSSGKQISKPSDSPTGTVQSMQARDDVRLQQQFTRNADDGKGWLSVIDGTLTSAVSNAQRARDLTLQGMNTGAGDTQSRTALADEIDNIRAGMIDAANTSFMGRPVFGGTTAGSVAFDKDGTYVGDSGQVTRTVSNGSKVRVDAGGGDVFGTGDTQMFAVLGQISDDLRNNPDSLKVDLQNLDTSTNNMQSQLSDVGARYNRIDQMRTAANNRITDLKTQLSNLEDIDLPKTITELQLQQTAYQAALAATSKVIQPSLVDFLK